MKRAYACEYEVPGQGTFILAAPTPEDLLKHADRLRLDAPLERNIVQVEVSEHFDQYELARQWVETLRPGQIVTVPEFREAVPGFSWFSACRQFHRMALRGLLTQTSPAKSRKPAQWRINLRQKTP